MNPNLATPQAAAAPARPERLNPTRLDRPAFLLSFPFDYSTAVPNNVWMEELSEADRQPNPKRAIVQFMELYRYLASDALVYLLPSPGDGLQDLVFTANLGIVLDHLPDRNTVVISNFTSEPRRGESAVGRRFFEELGYRVASPATTFEGEAELKHLHDNVYLGGYGIRSQRETYEWMEREFDMEIVKVKLSDPYLYHLDCTVFPITRDKTLVCTELFEEDEIAAIEAHTEILDVSADDCFSGICNSVRMSSTILNSSHLHDLKAGTEDYAHEVAKNRRLEDIASNLAFEVAYFNLSEYHKSGALLSCMVMHLNRSSYRIALTS